MADSAPYDYVAATATADRLITKFGAACLLRRNTATGTAFDPTLTPTDYATMAAVVDYTEQQRAGTDILRTDRRAFVAAGPLTALGITAVLPADSLVIGGVEMQIVLAKPLNPAGVTVVYDCQVRA